MIGSALAMLVTQKVRMVFFGTHPQVVIFGIGGFWLKRHYDNYFH
jgi:hypothetical protein